jgi:uncharacterized protein YndB with AHSA1/START domain
VQEPAHQAHIARGNDMKITISILVKADAAKVWSAWTTPADINQWNAASDDWHNPRSTNDLRVGGRFCYRMEARNGEFGFDFEGTYTEIEPQRRIAYVMDDDRGVTIDFLMVDGGIQVVETFDAEDVNAAEMQRQGWQAILDRFAAHVEASA